MEIDFSNLHVSCTVCLKIIDWMGAYAPFCSACGAMFHPVECGETKQDERGDDVSTCNDCVANGYTFLRLPF